MVKVLTTGPCLLRFNLVSIDKANIQGPVYPRSYFGIAQVSYRRWGTRIRNYITKLWDTSDFHQNKQTNKQSY